MAVQTSRTLYLGGTTGPVKNMTPAQLDALGYGYTYSLLWVAGIAILVGIAAFWIGFSARDIATGAAHPRGRGGGRAVALAWPPWTTTRGSPGSRSPTRSARWAGG